jgi:hypothetical protein
MLRKTVMTKCAQKSTPPESSGHPVRVVSPIPLAIALALAVNAGAQPAAGLPSHPIIEGWPMAKWGMSESEVIKAFDGAAKSLAEGTSTDAELRAAIGIDDVGVGGVSFRALFLFDRTDNLERIRLYGPAPTAPSDSQFRKVENYLAGKYGEPFSGTVGDSAQSVWILQRSVIHLEYLPLTALDLSFERRNGQTKELVMSGLVEVHRKHVRTSEPAISLPASKSSSYVQSGSAAQFGKRRVTKSKSQFDDSPTVLLALKAENSIKGWLTTSIPTLFIRCQERRTEVFVATGTQASVESGALDLHTVRLRYWIGSTDRINRIREFYPLVG